jgi:hypothetical protein
MRSDKRYAFLVKIGLLPSMAADAAGVTGEPQAAHQVDGQAAITPADIERARTHWYFSPTVPEPMRRILDARSRP